MLGIEVVSLVEMSKFSNRSTYYNATHSTCDVLRLSRAAAVRTSHPSKTTDKRKQQQHTSNVTYTNAHMFVLYFTLAYCSFVVIKVFKTHTQHHRSHRSTGVRIQNRHSCLWVCFCSVREQQYMWRRPNNENDARIQTYDLPLGSHTYCVEHSYCIDLTFHLYAMFGQSYSAW